MADECQHATITRREETKPVWCCDTCDEHFVPAQTLVTLTQGIAMIMRGEIDEEED